MNASVKEAKNQTKFRRLVKIKGRIIMESLVSKQVPLELICLLLLSTRDMTCMEMTDEAKRRSKGLLQIRPTAYLVASMNLCNDGMISKHTKSKSEQKSRWFWRQKKTSSAPSVYHLELAGREYCNKLIEEYQSIAQGMDYLFQSK